MFKLVDTLLLINVTKFILNFIINAITYVFVCGILVYFTISFNFCFVLAISILDYYQFENLTNRFIFRCRRLIVSYGKSNRRKLYSGKVLY